MKNISLLIAFIYTTLSANDYELKLYENILPSIFNKNVLKVYADAQMAQLLKDSNKFQVVDKCDSATVLLVGKDFQNISNVCRKKPLFATSYKSFKNSKNSFGAFYWRKGRPQIKFKQDIIEKFNINLPSSLRKYIK